MGTYTLLADENSRFSKDRNLFKPFKAHVVFNILVNGELTFSDNQMMSSPNLRLLVRDDGIIRTLVKDGQIRVACRDPHGEGPQTLQETFEQFLAEQKIPPAYRDLGESPEIDFMQRHGSLVPWQYDAVRRNFTSECERIILEQGRRSFETAQVDFLHDALREESQANEGLGRIFLQRDLPDMMDKAGILDSARALEFLTRCSDAVYLSNLPKTIGLQPIYAEEHRDSFMLLRGGRYELSDMGDPLDLKPRLTAKHFTEGLNMLDVEDIESVHQSDAFREFHRLNSDPDPVASFDPLFIVYGELNRVIEDRIFTRFRELAGHSPAPDPRQLRKQYGSWVSQGIKRATDVLSITPVFPSISGVALGWASSFLVDAVNAKINPERKHIDAAMHDLERAELEAYLRSQGKGDSLQFEHDVEASDGFEREIIVR
ncbi:hypothetical protein [Alteriqipengyuania lutimaris]|uniref:Uncharacterized protein n=1 Tax=Alteriqipengyuania lutimaris TaxID=1538146 RepID=A0A395LL23_9SPHN|nr:hypothetical protein [Alteriqipengyuania lutimaris]MBB3033216.1 hypothetical protein [Alteriqipengyuania lutimaris]RDS77736.1 hypothetical protein DL238_09055 [Alteriqipengyuania lutimaris]